MNLPRLPVLRAGADALLVTVDTGGEGGHCVGPTSVQCPAGETTVCHPQSEMFPSLGDVIIEFFTFILGYSAIMPFATPVPQPHGRTTVLPRLGFELAHVTFFGPWDANRHGTSRSLKYP